jgi:hypothetical protein
MTIQSSARSFTRLGAKLVGLAALCAPPSALSLPLADTQGAVSAVRVVLDIDGGAAFQVWFSSATRDRYGCILTNGYITVRQVTPGLSADNYNRIFALAMAAQASGKELALDSGGSNPCISPNVAWMVD